MNLKPFILLFGFLGGVISGRGQGENPDSLKTAIEQMPEDTTRVTALLQLSKIYLNSEAKEALPYAMLARDLSARLEYEKGSALAFKYIGNAFYLRSMYVEAMENWRQSLSYFEKLNDIAGIANIQSNIGAIYQNQGNESKALEFLFNSLRNSEEIGDQFRIASALINIGSVYQHKTATYDKAIQYYLRALPMSEKLQDNDQIGTIVLNIGEIYQVRGNIDSALYYFKKAEQAFQSTVDISSVYIDIGKVYELKKEYVIAQRYHQQAYDSAVAMDSKLYEAKALRNLAGIFLLTGNNKKALQYYLKAEQLAKDMNSTSELRDIYQGLAVNYYKLSDYAKAYKYQNLLLAVKDTIYNKEIDIKLSNYEFNFEIEKKQGQITLLEKENAIKEINIKQQRFAKNAFLAGFGLILIIAFILYRNYRTKVKVNKILDSQKAQIETLLLNILPVEVAKELQDTGHAKPRYYESVSVLFTDFKGFTTIADSLSPQEVVNELDAFFIAFDEIMEKYQIEKIKTIGDSYMCAGGIPVENDDHLDHIIEAALEIQKFMRIKNEMRTVAGLTPWELRIGIHIGPVVAGVVGKNKYAYDIWGSTVNIASRMESNGAPGQVNISAKTFELIKDRYHCTHRGKISAKNIGEIDMYFVNGAKSEIVELPPGKIFEHVFGNGSN
jgi:class 3 adenylate cyclase/tetratricopeptide (TPR) repeat protein